MFLILKLFKICSVSFIYTIYWIIYLWFKDNLIRLEIDYLKGYQIMYYLFIYILFFRFNCSSSCFTLNLNNIIHFFGLSLLQTSHKSGINANAPGTFHKKSNYST